MAQKLDDKLVDAVLLDWQAGMTQNQLAAKHHVSKGAVNAICKGSRPGTPAFVNRIINDLKQIRSDVVPFNLDEIDYTDALALTEQRAKDFSLFRKASLWVIELALKKVHDGSNMADLEKIQSIIGKGKENIYGRQADTSIQVNTGDNTQVISWEKEE